MKIIVVKIMESRTAREMNSYSKMIKIKVIATKNKNRKLSCEWILIKLMSEALLFFIWSIYYSNKLINEYFDKNFISLKLQIDMIFYYIKIV